jgi:2-iminobutanoate/2-iminopropanoate deaminase
MNTPIFHMVSGAPVPVAPFSHACEIDGWIFVTGQLPLDPRGETAELPADIASQTHLTFKNLLIVLDGLGVGLEQVVCARAFLTHFNEDYERFNAVYASYFPEHKRPARTCIGVTELAKGARVEIDFIARRIQ